MEYLMDPTDDPRAFQGQGWAFPPSFNLATGAPDLVAYEEDIWQSLQILFTTSLGERVLQSEYGCNLEDYLFMPFNVSLMSYLEDLIRRNINLHEPRIRLDNVDVTPFPAEGRMDIKLTYTVRSTNTRFNRVYPFYLTEGTNVEP